MRRIKELLKRIYGNLVIRRMISFLLFMLIVLTVFTRTTYLFRNSWWDRQHIIGIKRERRDSLDMVYIGGSAAFVYWQALKAWNDCGFASYAYANDNMQAENIKYYVKEVLKTQNPKVFVIDIRAFQYWDSSLVEDGVRNGTDSLNFSLDRLKMVQYSLANRKMTKEQQSDVLSYYLDIAKYHTNYDALKNPLNWVEINNTFYCANKGWEWMLQHETLTKPIDFNTKDKMKLPDKDQAVLVDLLKYCKQKNLKVLFVACPYWIKREDQMKYNFMKDLIKKYGFDYLNANEHFDEMGIDFSKDFYNVNHVNCFGAEKYTSFLENYLISHYKIPNHSRESQYESWNKEYTRFSQEEVSNKQVIELLIKREKNSSEIARELQKVSDVYKYITLAKDENFTVLVTTQGDVSNYLTADNFNMLNSLGFNTDKIHQKNVSHIGVISGNNLIYANTAIGELTDSGMSGKLSTLYEIKSGVDNKCSIKVGGQECAIQVDGINIVVFDNNRNVVVSGAAIIYDGRKFDIIRK